MKKILMLPSLGLILAQSALATLITFDDITMEDLIKTAGQPIFHDGGGWGTENFLVSLSGGVGAVSKPASIYSVPVGAAIFGRYAAFDLNSAYLTGSGADDTKVQIIGSYRGQILYDNIFTLSSSAPTLCIFDYVGIETVYFRAPGSTGREDSYVRFSMDDIIVNETASAIPEPETYVTGALLLLPLAFSTLQKLRRAR